MEFHMQFLTQMRDLLGNRYPDFMACYHQPVVRALRVNTLKGTVETLLHRLDLDLKPVPGCPEGFYLPPDNGGWGKSPYHHAGAYYLQEPAAMLPTIVLDPQPGDWVLDLCAAPGGKSTHIAARMQGQGVLIANEVVASRAMSLLSNLERVGAANTVITQMHPDQLCVQLTEQMDKVLVDAPCSGQGMFRRYPDWAAHWDPQEVVSCAKRQALILESAQQAVRSGGILVYSTCTFSLEENEKIIIAFLQAHPEFSLEKITLPLGEPSSPWFESVYPLNDMWRVFPFHQAEGHFIAKLRKAGKISPRNTPAPNCSARSNIFEAFWFETFSDALPSYRLQEDTVFLSPPVQIALHQGHILRQGVMAGKIKRNRFVPAHHLFQAFVARPQKRLCLPRQDPRIGDYLKGAEIPCDTTYQGYCQICLDGYPVGFGKASHGRMKNHYPKGLRELQ